MKHKLQAIKEGDQNLYQHLIKVIKLLLLSNDKQAYQLFEHYSQLVKKAQPSSPHYRNVQFEQLKTYITKTKALLNKINVGTQQQPAQPGPTGYVPNLMEEGRWLEKTGIGFGEECTYLIFKSLEKFSITKQIKDIKFWGKITALQNDYYIAEGQSEGAQEGELPPDVEPKGTGVNKITHWVCTDLNGEWKQLPIVNPTQMRSSRLIKYLFSGDLNREVTSNPHFPGKESHLLKCQIIRINFGCSIVPKDMFKVNEEDKKEIQAKQDWKIPSFDNLASLDSWVHHPQNLLKNGRLTLLKPTIPQGVEVDEQKLMKQLQLKDPLQQRLKLISKDQLNGKPLWAVKIFGDNSEYRAMSKVKEQINHGFISVRSLVWKGWTLVYHNKAWINIYIGNGIKSTMGWYYPKQPQLVLEEKNDCKEQIQPNFPPEQKKPQVPPPQQ